MQLENFNFELPEKLIAKYPCKERDGSRLLVFDRKEERLEHKNFKDITEYFSKGDILVRNQTKVLPARFYVENQHGTKIEILLLKTQGELIWSALAKPAKRIKEEPNKYRIADIEIELYKKDNQVFVDFLSNENYEKIIAEHSEMPIPPYFKRAAEDLDKERYQTIYAQDTQDGCSVAAPTAGLHFTDDVFDELRNKGVEVLDLTLHVGLGTFLPVKTEDIKDHKMHSEFYSVDKEVWQKIQAVKKSGKRVFALGSTSVRTLETVARTGELCAETDIYIYPGFEFQIVDAMVTNFHLPKSSLIMMISAFLGLDSVKTIYQEAIEQEYRFFSYGDCCLFL